MKKLFFSTAFALLSIAGAVAQQYEVTFKVNGSTAYYSTTVNSGGKVSYGIAADGNYRLDSVIVNDVDLTHSYVNSKLINIFNIKEDKLVEVYYTDDPTPADTPTPYITKVFDYMPAPGQFVNKLPVWEDGDTQETMNAKVLASIGNGVEQTVTLGSYGGYVTVGFDHTIENVAGKLDFRVLGNSFYSNANPDEDNLEGGSCEPGIIMVAYDANKNGVPDNDEWYEIAGSAHEDVKKEPWYNKGVENNNDMNYYFADFSLTYKKPAEPALKDYATYIPWTDNKGNTGYVAKNTFHGQTYYPQWIEQDSLTFTGSRLPQNGIDESGKGNYFVLYKFRYGYVDNETNAKDASAIDISWAVDADGNSVNLPGVDFIKVYNGVNQVNGWLGECSTEIFGIEDLHILGEEINANLVKSNE